MCHIGPFLCPAQLLLSLAVSSFLSVSVLLCLLSVSACFYFSFLYLSLFLISLHLCISLGHTHAHSGPTPAGTHTSPLAHSRPCPQTCLAGQLYCVTPQRGTALRDRDAGQGSTCLGPAPPPFNTHPTPATPTAGCAWGTCPGLSPLCHHTGLHSWSRCATSLEGRAMAPNSMPLSPPLPQDLGTQPQTSL